eukprot:scpid34041/ scgid33652/ 
MFVCMCVHARTGTCKCVCVCMRARMCVYPLVCCYFHFFPPFTSVCYIDVHRHSCVFVLFKQASLSLLQHATLPILCSIYYTLYASPVLFVCFSVTFGTLSTPNLSLFTSLFHYSMFLFFVNVPMCSVYSVDVEYSAQYH